MPSRNGKLTEAPRVVDPISRSRPVQVRDVEFLRRYTDRSIKITIPSAFTMAKLALDEYYGDQESLIMAYAETLNEEISELKAAGSDVIQIDEPYMQANPREADAFGVAAIDRALDSIEGPTVVHLCFGYAYVVVDKPEGYSFLPYIDACAAEAIFIEAALLNLDLVILENCRIKNFIRCDQSRYSRS